MHPFAAPHLAAVPRYVPGRTGAAPLVPLASNESAHGASPRASAAARAAVATSARYPLDGAPTLVAALAGRHGLDAGGLRITNGATEGITLLCRAFPGEVVVSEGTFPAYARSALAAGSTVRAVPRAGWCCDLDGLRAACGPETRLLFLANPDNPTGTSHDAARLAAWLQRLPRHVVVVIDEAYIEYAVGASDALALGGLHPNLVVLRSFSKAHGLAALRVGWLATTPGIADALDRVRDAFNVSGVGIAAALASVADPTWLDRVTERNAAERSRLATLLRRRGLAPVPSAANFLCVPVPGTGTAFAAALAAEGVAVRSLDEWGVPGAIRVTVATAVEHASLLAALDSILTRPSPLAEVAA